MFSHLDDPTPPRPGPAERAAVALRVSRVRRRRTTGLAAAVTVLLVAAVVGVAVAHHPTHSTPVSVGGGTPPSRPPRAVTGPRGWQRGDYDLVRLWVPHTWALRDSYASSQMSCGSVLPPGQLVLGDVAPQAECGSPLPTVTVRKGRPLQPGATRTTINGFTVYVSHPANAEGQLHIGSTGPVTEYQVPALSATIFESGPLPTAVIGSLGPSPAAIVLSRATAATTPTGWRSYTYDGIRFSAPGSWSLKSGESAGDCGPPFDSRHPAVVLGPYSAGLTSCPGYPPGEQPGADGIWVHPGGPSHGHTTAETSPAGVVTKVDFSLANGFIPALSLYLHGQTVELGLGRNPIIARNIYDSIRYLPAAPDHPPIQGCPTTLDRVMPAPTRLTSTLSLFNNAAVVLFPPLPSQQPTIPASEAWHKAFRGIGPIPGDAYHVVLARIGQGRPAQPTGGLSWVVYSTEPHTPLGPCNGSNAMGFDATTGAQVLDAGES